MHRVQRFRRVTRILVLAGQPACFFWHAVGPGRRWSDRFEGTTASKEPRLYTDVLHFELALVSSWSPNA